MLPSDLLLNPLNQVIDGYNDKIVVNTSGFELGKQAAAKQEQKPVVKQAVKRRRLHVLDDHQDEVTSVIFAIGGLSLFAIWWVH